MCQCSFCSTSCEYKSMLTACILHNIKNNIQFSTYCLQLGCSMYLGHNNRLQSHSPWKWLVQGHSRDRCTVQCVTSGTNMKVQRSGLGLHSLKDEGCKEDKEVVWCKLTPDCTPITSWTGSHEYLMWNCWRWGSVSFSYKCLLNTNFKGFLSIKYPGKTKHGTCA